MVLGLIDFLLGGKKKSKIPKTGTIATPVGGQASNSENNQTDETHIPDGVNNTTENNSDLKIDESSNTSENNISNSESSQIQQKLESETNPSLNKATNPIDNGEVHQKRPISEIITKLNTELKSSGERVTTLVTDFKELENTVNSLGHKVSDLEESKKTTEEKLSIMDENMTKFLSLYELINNQYNPFIDKEQLNMKNEKPMLVSSDGQMVTSEDESPKLDLNNSENLDFSQKPIDLEELKILAPENAEIEINEENTTLENLDSVLLELDTLNIEEAAADSVPLKVLKNNTNSLVVILSWLEYLIKRVGINETRNSLRYYTEVLKWLTPEVYFELDKYLKGMKDKKIPDGNESLEVKDHIVSLYFITKLNEKTLDEKLTKAVLQIIKQ